ncbi:ABC transporter ATP-binding protein [Arcanobacterium phocisimile]|uniref:ABC transporter ATP-binding protein n=1 Tax=Arcanobacterium phocisimile TaxID=1302235 RepID=A0ABX7II58_9ACTO|nr:ABC transporter ATP-binding protein [Arcanobacterium phocisimile]QRV02818.1 ABC transporter ATP-binding protein [Arcanobacterium phocisimile]
MTLVRLVWRYLHDKKRLLALIVVLQFSQVLLSLLLPNLNARIIDNGIIVGDTSYIWRTGLLMLGVSLAQITCIVGAMYVGARTAMNLGRELRSDAFRHVQGFAATEQHKFGASTLITRATNDITQIQSIVLNSFAILIMAPLLGIGGIVMAVLEDAQLSLLLLVVVPLLSILIIGTMKAMISRSVLQQQRIDRINTLLREQLIGVRVIRAFTQEQAVAKKFDRANRDLRDVWLQIGLLWAFLMPTAQLVVGVSSVGVVWFGGQRIAEGLMNVGALTAYISYLMMIMGAVLMSGFMVMMFPRGQVSAGRLQEIFDTKSSIASPTQPLLFPHRPRTYQLREVSLQYPGAERAVLNEINVELRPGRTVALIGSTGSGKSSILRLLPRLMDPSAGTIFVNDVDIRDLDLEKLRSTIAFVPQKSFLFSGTIATNVAGVGRGNTDIDVERVKQALRAAQAWEFICELDDTIDAPVESGGVNFSGGQRQRLAIARAIYRCLPDAEGNRSADLIVFDDSFSALDNATDAQLRDALPSYIGDVAVLIVGQRVSTIRNADIIHVLDEGEIVGSGTHAELLTHNSTYQEIVASQMSEEEAK